VSETLRKEGIDGEAAIVAAFRKQRIKGQHLNLLSHELLRTELEFGVLGHRLSFLQVCGKTLKKTGENAIFHTLNLSSHPQREACRLFGVNS
jgi:hypothetical protein